MPGSLVLMLQSSDLQVPLHILFGVHLWVGFHFQVLGLYCRLYISKCFFNVLTSITLTYDDGWNPSMSGNVNVTVQNTGTGTGGGGGGVGAGCFALGTEILMNDNTWKRVETLEIGDVLKSVKIPTLPDGDEYGMYATARYTRKY